MGHANEGEKVTLYSGQETVNYFQDREIIKYHCNIGRKAYFLLWPQIVMIISET